MNALEGKCAIVTGAGRGVGRATALRLSRAGARVVVNDLDAEPAAVVAGEITASGGGAVASSDGAGDGVGAEEPAVDAATSLSA